MRILDARFVMRPLSVMLGVVFSFAIQVAMAQTVPASGSAAPRTGDVTSLPLKPGYYVASDTPCGRASNATLSLVRRNGMNVSRMTCDFKKIEQVGRARYRVTEECKEIDQDKSEAAVTTYEVANNDRYKSIFPDGESYQARYCAQSSLPAPWRDNDISDLIRDTAGSTQANTLDVPIMEEGGDGQMANCASSAVAGLKPGADSFLAVRAGPGGEYRKLAELRNGDVVVIFEVRGDWAGVVYRTPNVRCSSKATRPVTYDNKGWVHRRWLKDVAG